MRATHVRVLPNIDAKIVVTVIAVVAVVVVVVVSVVAVALGVAEGGGGGRGAGAELIQLLHDSPNHIPPSLPHVRSVLEVSSKAARCLATGTNGCKAIGMVYRHSETWL